MRVFTGKVVSKKMDKTATVVIERIKVAPIYGKRYKQSKKYHLHDELGAKVGDVVEFVASRPYSKLKKWKIVKIIREGKKPAKGKTKK